MSAQGFRKVAAGCRQAAIYSGVLALVAEMFQMKYSSSALGFGAFWNLGLGVYAGHKPELRRYRAPFYEMAAASTALSLYAAEAHTRVGSGRLLEVAGALATVAAGAWGAGKLFSRRQHVQQIG